MRKRRKRPDFLTCANPECKKEFPFGKMSSIGKDRKYCGKTCSNEMRRGRYDPDTAYPTVRHEGKRIYLHILIWMQAHPDEKLLPTDIIHHIDENPFNRSPDNLERLSGDNARLEHLRRHNFHRHKRKG